MVKHQSVMKTFERNKAIELRKPGKTFAEILEEVVVSKGSLSYWLRYIKLTDKQLTSNTICKTICKNNPNKLIQNGRYISLWGL